MSAIRDILASDPHETDASSPPPPPPSAPRDMPAASIESTAPSSGLEPTRRPHDRTDEAASGSPTGNTGEADGETAYTATTTSTRRNASGSVSSVYSGNKMRHLKKDDGIPLWRKDIQYDFLRLVFYDESKVFTKYSDGSRGHTFAEVYIDAMAKSSKCSKILKEKLLQDHDSAISMAMVCLLVNVGRMNTTLNFFPGMRAQLRTYHSIPALQAHQDPTAYKQLQDAPRLKSILKGATEDEPQPGTVEDMKTAPYPRTNAVNLVFVMSQYAPKVSEVHFQPPRDFFDLVVRGSLSSASRARAFLWLMWWYLESDFTFEDSQQNPFGAGQYGEGDQQEGLLPLKVPALESLTEEQAAAENVDTPEEEHFGEVKRKDRIAILASEPTPAMTALKRARKEREKVAVVDAGQMLYSDDEASEIGWPRAVGIMRVNPETASDYTRSPSPTIPRGPSASHPKAAGDMRINHLLNADGGFEQSPPRPATPSAAANPPVKKGPGRGNWGRRNKPKPEKASADDRHHVPLLPNTSQLSFVNESPQPIPATPGSAHAQMASSMAASPPNSTSLSLRPGQAHDHVPTPSYQAQKRSRGVTQHQSALIYHRRLQIDYTLDKRIRKIHIRARRLREVEGALLRAWKRVRMMPPDYDSEEEEETVGKTGKTKERGANGDKAEGKENANVDANSDEVAHIVRRPMPTVLSGFARFPGERTDVGEEAKSLARTFRRVARRFDRWAEVDRPGDAIIQRRTLREDGAIAPLTTENSSLARMTSPTITTTTARRRRRRSVPPPAAPADKHNLLDDASIGPANGVDTVHVRPRLKVKRKSGGRAKGRISSGTANTTAVEKKRKKKEGRQKAPRQVDGGSEGEGEGDSYDPQGGSRSSAAWGQMEVDARDDEDAEMGDD